jgi:hypothetical protein
MNSGRSTASGRTLRMSGTGPRSIARWPRPSAIRRSPNSTSGWPPSRTAMRTRGRSVCATRGSPCRRSGYRGARACSVCSRDGLAWMPCSLASRRSKTSTLTRTANNPMRSGWSPTTLPCTAAATDHATCLTGGRRKYAGATRGASPSRRGKRAPRRRARRERWALVESRSGDGCGGRQAQ